MARKPSTTQNAPVIVSDADTPGLPAMVDAANQLAVQHHERQIAARSLAARIGYELPGDCPDPELIVRDIAVNMRRSVESCLQVGKGLLVLKAACEHGEFIQDLDKLGIEHTIATRFMQAALKFPNVATSQHLLKAVGNQSKLFEIIVLDDEQIEEIELTGQTGGLALDSIERMSVRELRGALRELRADAEAKDAVLEKTQKKLLDLQVRSRRKIVAEVDWPEALVPVCEQIAAAGRKIATGVSELESCRIALFEAAAELESEPRARFEAALAHVGEAYETALARAERHLARERDTFDKTLGVYAHDEADSADSAEPGNA
ncbi:MAG: hypothetical protein LBS70_09905 [Candidatus Accumulibacter sp.]|jgi:hypothetical protein|nr:hypothetical protein [Accumulibacter sp.]